MKIWNHPVWRRWTLACGAGEFLGIGVAGMLAFAYLQWVGEPETGWEKTGQILIGILAGMFEGFILATFQWHILGKLFPSLPARMWIGYTMLVAVLGWILGMVYPTFFSSGQQAQGVPIEPPFALVIAGAAAMGLILGALFGWFQWLAFRKYVRRTNKWIRANAFGWLVGMIWIFACATWPDEESSLTIILLAGSLGGILAGLSVGSITGLYLLKILQDQPPLPQSTT